MGESRHTPGPWALEFDKFEQGGWIIRSADGDAMMGNAIYYPWQSSNVHDAHLIAAAPDMLEALEEVYMHADMADDTAEMVRAAISKAKGESK